MFALPLRVLSGSNSSSCSLSRGGGSALSLCPPVCFRPHSEQVSLCLCLQLWVSTKQVPSRTSSHFRLQAPLPHHSSHTLLPGEGRGLVLCLWGGAPSGYCVGPGTRLPGCQIMVHPSREARGEGLEGISSQKCPKPGCRGLGAPVTLMAAPCSNIEEWLLPQARRKNGLGGNAKHHE